MSAGPLATASVHAHGAEPGVHRLDTGTLVIRYELALSLFLSDADLDRLTEAIARLRATEAAARTAPS
jgi:hypothetical protein